MIFGISIFVLACSDAGSKNTAETIVDNNVEDPVEVEALKVCVSSCSTTADCSAGYAHLDEDNYRCEDGACVYTGCNSDSECSELGDFVCYSQPEYAICAPSCSTAADCDNGYAYMDEDNHRCEDGACVYTGCNSDSECAELGNYVCHTQGGQAACVPACQSVMDCASDLLYVDSDNYRCEEGACVYTGCNDDTECEELGNFVCALP